MHAVLGCTSIRLVVVEIEDDRSEYEKRNRKLFLADQFSNHLRYLC